MDDEIQIRGLEVWARIGISEEERAEPQRLAIDLKICPANGLADLGDAIEKTTDYAAVAEDVRGLCEEGERNLIETLAEEIAGLVTARHGPCRVEVEVRKFILPNCEYVSVKVRREAT